MASSRADQRDGQLADGSCSVGNQRHPDPERDTQDDQSHGRQDQPFGVGPGVDGDMLIRAKQLRGERHNSRLDTPQVYHVSSADDLNSGIRTDHQPSASVHTGR